jgi:hypothetical protein
MKKLILLALVILMIKTNLMAGGFAGGTGTAKYPFQVSTAAQLDDVRNYMGSTYYFILINNIDLTTYLASGAGWTKWGALGWLPIGTDIDPFQANFNGKGFEIIGLKFDRSGVNYLGLFGSIGADGDVSDLGVRSNSSFSLKGENYIGVLCGSLNSGIISDCYTVGKIAGHNYLGGLIGTNTAGTIQNCKTNSDVTGTYFIGAFTGSNASGGTINNSFADGSVTASNDAGGFTGYITESTISDCYSFATVSQPVNTYTIFGGFAGINHRGVITNCYSTGWVKFNGTTQTYLGFCGFIDTGTGYLMSGNFWDTETSGATSTVGIAAGKTTTLMKTCGTFTAAGWDFMDETTNGSEDNWGINAAENNGYPFLAWQGYENNPMFLNGDGTEANPFQITTAEELNNVRNFLGDDDSAKHFLLMNDIDLSDYLATGEGYDTWGTYGWLSIGEPVADRHFTGVFDGDGHKITGLWINRPSYSDIALFGYTALNGIIRNLGVETDESSSIRGYDHVSILVALHTGTIENCYVKGDVEAISNTLSYAGAISGRNFGNISYCYAYGTVTGGGFIGGLAGRNSDSISNCYAHVNVTLDSETADTTAGGFIGMNYRGKVINNYSTGWVKYGEELQTNKGFCGNADSTGVNFEMTCNFWDTETSGASSTWGEGLGYATGKTTFQMKKQSTFIGWDFGSIWSIVTSNDTLSYPYLTNNPQSPAPGLEKLFNGGDGSSGNPYEITTAKQLNNLRYYLGPDYANVCFELMNDIDLTDYLTAGDGFAAWGTEGWLPIGSYDSSERLEGNFNGGGNKISGFWINRPDGDHMALFACLGEDGKVENLGIEISESGSVIGKDCTGALCSVNLGVILNCFAKGILVGEDRVGILVGDNRAVIYNSYTNGEVTGNTFYIGGLVGYNYYGTIMNCYSKTDVISINDAVSEYYGGFVGTNFQGIIACCYSTGKVKHKTTLLTDRGFCGSITEGGEFAMTGNFWDMQTSGSTTSACNATGKTTAEMKIYATFISGSWDFMGESTNGTEDIWGINHAENNGYPFLSWQGYENNPLNEVVYNLQLHDLTVTGNEAVCFNAYDSITVAGDGTTVIVENGALTELIAGQSIRFLPGFHAQSGSYVNGSITTDGTFCGDALVRSIVGQPADKSIEVKALPETQTIFTEEKSVKVYPNPNNGQFTLELVNIESGKPIYIYNMLGERIYQSETMNRSQKINIPDIKSGIYFVKVWDGTVQLGKKIIVNF